MKNTIKKLLREGLMGNTNGAPMNFDYNKISNVEFGGLDNGGPRQADAFIYNFDYDGQPATEEMLDAINNNDELVHELLIDQIY